MPVYKCLGKSTKNDELAKEEQKKKEDLKKQEELRKEEDEATRKKKEELLKEVQKNVNVRIFLWEIYNSNLKKLILL